LLNGETVKVLGGSVPPERAGMASGLASTTRFIGILVGTAGLGAVLSNVVRANFVMAALTIGLNPTAATGAARRVTSGDLSGMLNAAPKILQEQLRSAGLAAFADGFAAASLLAAIVAAIASVLVFVFVRSEETAPTAAPAEKHHRCMAVDCRHPI
jgi:hypothetical protein